MAGNVGILAATDLVYIHHDGSFKLNTPAFLKMKISPFTILQENADVCSIHVDEQGVFTLKPIKHSEEIVEMFITLPVMHFSGRGGAITKRKRTQQAEHELHVVYEGAKICNILSMVAIKEMDNIRIWMDCIEDTLVDTKKEIQKSLGYTEIPFTISPDLIIYDHDCISINVHGAFSVPVKDLPSPILVQFMKSNNFTVFPIRISNQEEMYGVFDTNITSTVTTPPKNPPVKIVCNVNDLRDILKNDCYVCGTPRPGSSSFIPPQQHSPQLQQHQLHQQWQYDQQQPPQLQQHQLHQQMQYDQHQLQQQQQQQLHQQQNNQQQLQEQHQQHQSPSTKALLSSSKHQIRLQKHRQIQKHRPSKQECSSSERLDYFIEAPTRTGSNTHIVPYPNNLTKEHEAIDRRPNSAVVIGGCGWQQLNGHSTPNITNYNFCLPPYPYENGHSNDIDIECLQNQPGPLSEKSMHSLSKQLDEQSFKDFWRQMSFSDVALTKLREKYPKDFIFNGLKRVIINMQNKDTGLEEMAESFENINRFDVTSKLREAASGTQDIDFST